MIFVGQARTQYSRQETRNRPGNHTISPRVHWQAVVHRFLGELVVRRLRARVMPDLKEAVTQRPRPKDQLGSALVNDEHLRHGDEVCRRGADPIAELPRRRRPAGQAFGRAGIPLGILIGADGTVRFYQTGIWQASELRSAISDLGPAVQRRYFRQRPIHGDGR